MKQNKKRKNCAVFCFAGKRIFFLFMKWLHGKKEKKALLIYDLCVWIPYSTKEYGIYYSWGLVADGCPQTKQQRGFADARPVRGRHSPRCAPADTRSAGCKRQRLKQQQRGASGGGWVGGGGSSRETEASEEEAGTREPVCPRRKVGRDVWHMRLMCAERPGRYLTANCQRSWVTGSAREPECVLSV